MDHTKRILASTMAMATLAALACAPAANAATPLSLTVNAGDNQNTLKGRRLTAYRLADYVDGTYVSTDGKYKDLDGVAVHTPDSLKSALDPVLAKVTGVNGGNVANLPGWADSGKDPIAWMGGFRQHDGSDQSAGEFGFGWNESGPQHMGTNSPDKAYVGTVREFADQIAKDATALAAVKAQPHSATVTCQAGASCIIPIDDSGVYMILDTGSDTTWTGTLNGLNATYNVGSAQPMIVPSKPSDADLATVSGYNQPMNRDRLGTTGKLGEITIKNVDDQEVLPPGGQNPPKKRDESVAAGKDAADNASDVGDVIPYVVHYRVPDLSAYRNAKDNGRPWIYTYRVSDQTTKGLRINSVPTATITDTTGRTVTIPLTHVTTLPNMPNGANDSSAAGQTTEPAEAWYYLEQQDGDASHMVIGLGRWLVDHYGDLAANDKTKTLYGHQVEIKYSAQVTEKALDNGNKVNNRNHLVYSNQPEDVTSARTTTTPDVVVKQWTYDIDLHKRAATSYKGLAGAEFDVAVKNNGNASDSKANGSALKLVKTADGVYREAKPGENGSNHVVTGPDGLLRLRGLDLGVYTLKETKAPTDYQPLKSSEDITIAAKFTDDKSNYITPDAQTEATETITQNNSIIPLVRPMLTFRADTSKLPAGLTITKAVGSQTAKWSGQDASKRYYADDKTNWVPADLTLLNQPINVMLAKTGGTILFGTVMAAGLALLAIGAAIVPRRRETR